MDLAMKNGNFKSYYNCAKNGNILDAYITVHLKAVHYYEMINLNLNEDPVMQHIK